MSEIARGSNGGAARAAKLTPEQRSAIAKQAAAKRWSKTKDDPIAVGKSYINSKTEEKPELHPIVINENPNPIPVPFIYKEEPRTTPVTTIEPLPAIQQAQRKPRPRPVPKAFKGASSYADKRLSEAIKERAEYMGRVAALNAEIPSLVQIIRALGSSTIPAEAMQSYPMQTFNTPMQEFTNPAMINQPYQPAPAIDQNPIDPALYRTNATPLPGLVPAAANAPMVPNTSVGGAMDLDYVPTDESEGPRLANMGGGWV